MTSLTRRLRNTENHVAWEVLYGDVAVGGLSEINGTEGRMLWQWCCGFYPGCDKRTQQTAGNCDTFEEARSALERAWEKLKPQITPAMFDEWRRDRAFTRWKYAMRDARCRMPTQSTTGRSRCFCGADISIDAIAEHVYSLHMERT